MGNLAFRYFAGKMRNFFTNVHKKVQFDATVCRHLFTAQSVYMFWVSQHPSSGVLKTVSATSGIGHDTGTATSFQRGLIRLLPLKMTALRSFENSASNYSTTKRNSPEDLVPQYESGLATNNVFQLCAVFRAQCGKCPA